MLFNYPEFGNHLVIGKFCQSASGTKFIMSPANHHISSATTYPFNLRQPESHSTMQRFTASTGFPSGENALRVVKELGLCAENKTAAELVTRAEAAQLLHAVLTQTLTVVPPDTPITVENLTQWNVNAFLLELRKVPQPILDAFNENGWAFVIGTEYLTALSRKLGVNCIGAAAYTEKRIYVFEASAVLHEFGHFLDCAMGFPQEHKDLYALEAASAPMKQRAKSNSLEYFAEFFAYWCSGNTRILEQLKELTPETYAYFDGLSSAWTAGVCD